VITVLWSCRCQGRLVGVAAYECIAEDLTPVAAEGVAEIALVVADDQARPRDRHAADGTLAALARRRDINRFVAETLPDNAPMLDVFKEAGYTVMFRRTLDTVAVSIDLTPGPNVLTALDQRERAATCAQPHAAAAAAFGGDRRRRFRRERSVARCFPNLLLSRVRGRHLSGSFASAGSRRAAFALPVYPRLADVPGPVDLLVLAVPGGETLAVIADCAPPR